MLDVLRNRTYRHLFFAQVIALLGTGLATVALGLLAFDLAGANAGAVLGTALAIKMVAYIAVAPVAAPAAVAAVAASASAAPTPSASTTMPALTGSRPGRASSRVAYQAGRGA